MAITTLLLHENLSKHVISVLLPQTSLQLVIGPVRTCGQAKEVLQHHHRNQDKENTRYVW